MTTEKEPKGKGLVCYMSERLTVEASKGSYKCVAARVVFTHMSETPTEETDDKLIWLVKALDKRLKDFKAYGIKDDLLNPKQHKIELLYAAEAYDTLSIHSLHEQALKHMKHEWANNQRLNSFIDYYGFTRAVVDADR